MHMLKHCIYTILRDPTNLRCTLNISRENKIFSLKQLYHQKKKKDNNK